MRARAPASSANLGPGFDTLAVALDCYVSVEVEPADALRVHSEGEGAGLFDDASHLAARVVTEVLGHDRVAVTVRSQIPVARGLGSSAALAAAAAAAAGADDPFAIAAAYDGHPENAAASVFGGLLAATTVEGIAAARAAAAGRGPGLRRLGARARPGHPRSPGRAPRHAQPRRRRLQSRPHGPAGRPGWPIRRTCVAAATEDRIHQPARTALFPEAPGLLDALVEAGALAACWSGAGPTLIGFVTRERQEQVRAGAAGRAGRVGRAGTGDRAGSRSARPRLRGRGGRRSLSGRTRSGQAGRDGMARVVLRRVGGETVHVRQAGPDGKQRERERAEGIDRVVSRADRHEEGGTGAPGERAVGGAPGDEVQQEEEDAGREQVVGEHDRLEDEPTADAGQPEGHQRIGPASQGPRRESAHRQTATAKRTGASRATAEATVPETPERVSTVAPETAPPALNPLKFSSVARGAETKNGSRPAAATTTVADAEAQPGAGSGSDGEGGEDQQDGELLGEDGQAEERAGDDPAPSQRLRQRRPEPGPG